MALIRYRTILFFGQRLNAINLITYIFMRHFVLKSCLIFITHYIISVSYWLLVIGIFKEYSLYNNVYLILVFVKHVHFVSLEKQTR